MLPLINFEIRIGDGTGHPIGNLIYLAKKHIDLIDSYIRSVVHGMQTYERAKRHREMCKALHIDYETFKPFDDSSIVGTPNFHAAQNIFWMALAKEGQNIMQGIVDREASAIVSRLKSANKAFERRVSLKELDDAK